MRPVKAWGWLKQNREPPGLIALERETASVENGPARKFLPSLRSRQLVISIVSVEEVLDGAADALGGHLKTGH